MLEKVRGETFKCFEGKMRKDSIGKVVALDAPGLQIFPACATRCHEIRGATRGASRWLPAKEAALKIGNCCMYITCIHSSELGRKS